MQRIPMIYMYFSEKNRLQSSAQYDYEDVCV